jgi:hypothetical protein
VLFRDGLLMTAWKAVRYVVARGGSNPIQDEFDRKRGVYEPDGSCPDARLSLAQREARREVRSDRSRVAVERAGDVVGRLVEIDVRRFWGPVRDVLSSSRPKRASTGDRRRAVLEARESCGGEHRTHEARQREADRGGCAGGQVRSARHPAVHVQSVQTGDHEAGRRQRLPGCRSAEVHRLRKSAPWQPVRVARRLRTSPERARLYRLAPRLSIVERLPSRKAPAPRPTILRVVAARSLTRTVSELSPSK